MNYSRYEKVSSYWKDFPPSIEEIAQIMMILNWRDEDLIRSCSYADSYTWNGSNNEWIVERDEGSTDEDKISEESVEEGSESTQFGPNAVKWIVYSWDGRDIGIYHDTVFFCN